VSDDPTTTISDLENSLYDYVEAMLAPSTSLPISLYSIHRTGKTMQKTPAEVGLRGHRECWITPQQQDIVCRFPVSKDGISVTEMRFKYIISLWVRTELLNTLLINTLDEDTMRLTIPTEGHKFLDLVGMNQARVLKKYQFPDHMNSVCAADILLDFNALISLDKTPTASSVDSIQIEVKKSDTNAALWKEKL
jgi:hypothetical protein